MAKSDNTKRADWQDSELPIYSSSVENLSKQADERKASNMANDKRDALLGDTSKRYKSVVSKYESDSGDFFVTPKSEADAVAQQVVRDVLIENEEVAEWVDFWELIDQQMPKIMDKVDSVKARLLAVIDGVEALVKSLKKIIDMVAAIVSLGLDMASLAIILLKSVIQSLKLMIKQILKIFDVPFLKSEMKVTDFWLWDKIPSENTKTSKESNAWVSHIDAMAPYVSAALNELVTTRFNRPTAQNELCFAAFLPAAFSAETAAFISKCAKLPDLFKLANAKAEEAKKLVKKDVYVPKGTLELVQNLEELITTYQTFWQGDDEQIQAFKEITEASIGILADMDSPEVILSSLATTLSASYDQYAAEFEGTANSSVASAPEEKLPGILYGVKARIKEAKKSTQFEINFANGQSHYIAAIYKKGKYDSAVTECFLDSSFLFAVALQISSLKKEIYKQVRLFNTAVRWGGSQHPGRGLNFGFREVLANKQVGKVSSVLFDKLKVYFDKLFGRVAGMNLFEHYTKFYPIKVISDDELFMRMLQNILKKQPLKNPANDSRKQAEQRGSAVTYHTRSAINPYALRVPPEFTLDIPTEEGDTLLLALVPDRAKYYGLDFVETGEQSHSAKQQIALSPGSLRENLNIRWVKLAVKPKGTSDRMMIWPRWYGLGTSTSGDISLNYLFNLIPSLNEIIGLPMQTLESIEKMLDKFGESISDFKLMLKTWMDVINHYYNLILDFIASLRRFLMAFGLPNLPTVYVVIWQGNAADLPSKIMSGLYKEGIANSTYGGYVVFGSSAATNLFIESYKAHKLGQETIDDIKKKFEAAGAEYASLQENMEGKLDTLMDIDWIGKDAYDEKKKLIEAKEEVDEDMKSDPDTDDSGDDLIDITGYTLHEMGINIYKAADSLHGGALLRSWNTEDTAALDDRVFVDQNVVRNDLSLANSFTEVQRDFGTGPVQASETITDAAAQKQRLERMTEAKRNL